MRIHKKKENNLNCEVCEFKTNRKFILKRHQKVHEKVQADPLEVLTCSGCDKVFQTKSSLNAHNKTHTKENAVKCLICHKTFSKKGNLP